MRILLRIVAGIVAADALVVVALAIVVTLHTHRSRREIRDLERLWRFELSTPSFVLHRFPGRRLAAVAVVTALVCSGTAAASPHARRVIASTFGTVVGGIGAGPNHQEHASGLAIVEDPASLVPAPAAIVTTPPTRDAHAKPARTDEAATIAAPVASATTQVVDSPPALLGVSTSTTEIQIGWTDVAGASGYSLERSRDGQKAWIEIARTGGNITTYDDTGLVPGTTFYYRVSTVTPVGESPPSDVMSATTGLVPSAPTNVVAVSVSTSGIDVTWADVGGETGYRVERSPDGEAGWLPIATTGQDVTAYSDVDLAPETTYFYRIVAVSLWGESSPSEVAWATTSRHPVDSMGGVEPSDNAPDMP